MGFAGTLLLHGLALQSLPFGAAHRKPPPEFPAAGSASARATPIDELVLVTVANPPTRQPDYLDQIAALRPKLAHPSIPSPDPPLAVEVSLAADSAQSDVPEPMNAGDPALRALMWGRYTGQIRARIERAWIRPRSAVEDSSYPGGTVATTSPDTQFTCLVQIRQTARGDVEEILLVQCNGSEAWRHSLVVAINQSSPLPAPPTPSVFSRVLNMTFEAHAYQPGTDPDGYAVERNVEVARARPQDSIN